MVAVEPPVRTVESPPSPRSGSPRSEDSDRDVKDQENKDSTSKKRKTLFKWTQRIRLTPGSPLEVRLDDGFSWRKYGQKEILGARYPRGYYRCTHRYGQGCLATKQVQRSDEEPMIFEVTYCRTHTCTQAASSSQVPPSLSSDTSQTLYQQTNQQQQEQRNRLLQEAEEVKRRNEFLEREIVLANQKVQRLSGCQVVDDDRSTVASDLSIEGFTEDKAANLHAAKIIEEENTRLREENGVLKHKSEFLERQITILNQKLQRALDHKENEDNASTIDLDYQDQDAESDGAHGTEWKEELMQEGDEHDQLPCALRKLEQQLGLSDVELETHSSVLDQLPDEKKMSKQIVKLEEATNEVGPLASQSIYPFGNHILSGARLADAKKPVDDLSEENFHCPPPEFPSDLKTYLLRELDFSHTNINFLPEALPALVSLQKLILKRCQLLMELPPQVGQLPNLEMLDLDETEVFDLPQEIGMLFKLKFLRVSFYGYMNRGKKLSQNALIHPKTISTLSQLAELSIDVNPDDERWYDVVGYVIEETCSLEKLRSLTLYVPDVEILKKRKPGNTSLSCYPLHRFKLTVGQHIQRFMSPIPKEVEAHFQAWDKCVKFVKGKSIPNEIKKVLEYANAFYLEHHASATSLSDFGIENLRMLEFCLLEECDKIETILDGGKSSEGSALLNLQYLRIYLLENLVTIWRNPENDQSLSRLKFLALHECQELSEIFSVYLLANLTELEVLIVEDCPQVTSVVTLSRDDVPAFNYSVGDTHFLPKLKTLVLIWLPNLVSISSGLSIAANLEKIGFYNCPELENLSTKELSSDSLEVIKGEKRWWEALKWDESEWDSMKIDYLQSKFSPIQREKDVMSQMQEMWESPSPKQSN